MLSLCSAAVRADVLVFFGELGGFVCIECVPQIERGRRKCPSLVVRWARMTRRPAGGVWHFSGECPECGTMTYLRRRGSALKYAEVREVTAGCA